MDAKISAPEGYEGFASFDGRLWRVFYRHTDRSDWVYLGVAPDLSAAEDELEAYLLGETVRKRSEK